MATPAQITAVTNRRCVFTWELRDEWDTEGTPAAIVPTAVVAVTLWRAGQTIRFDSATPSANGSTVTIVERGTAGTVPASGVVTLTSAETAEMAVGLWRMELAENANDETYGLQTLLVSGAPKLVGD